MGVLGGMVFFGVKVSPCFIVMIGEVLLIDVALAMLTVMALVAVVTARVHILRVAVGRRGGQDRGEGLRLHACEGRGGCLIECGSSRWGLR